MVERGGCSALRLASAACGIGRMGDRTQGYVVDSLWIDHAAGVRQVCERAVAGAIRAGCVLACPRTDGQADARHLALCLAPAGLLAVASSRVATGGRNDAVRTGLAAADSREGAALRPGRGLDGPHLD